VFYETQQISAKELEILAQKFCNTSVGCSERKSIFYQQSHYIH